MHCSFSLFGEMFCMVCTWHMYKFISLCIYSPTLELTTSEQSETQLLSNHSHSKWEQSHCFDYTIGYQNQYKD